LKAKSRKQKAEMSTDLKDRTRDFALRVIRLCAALPHDREGDVVARQLVKAGTSPGAHFREGLRARTKAEYVAKMNGGLMELEGAGFTTAKKLEPLKVETTELIAIFTSLMNKWRGR
jgi:four helix bundle protein